MLGSTTLTSMIERGRTQNRFVEPRVTALVSYGELLARHYGFRLDDAARSRLETLAGENAELLASTLESRAGFAAIAQFAADRFKCEIDPVVAAKLRMSARREAGLETFDGTEVATIPSPRPVCEGDDRFLDAEIITIYW